MRAEGRRWPTTLPQRSRPGHVEGTPSPLGLEPRRGTWWVRSGGGQRRPSARPLPQSRVSLLAETTRGDRHSWLREGGPLLGFFGERRLDEIGVAELRSWWNDRVLAVNGRSTRTGRAYLDVLSSVLGYACDLELLERNPVPAFRETLRRRAGTKRARQEATSGRSVRPIERPEDLAALVAEARGEGPASAALVLLCLDAGLHLGEALGRRWQAIEWGDDRDRTRALRIEENRPTGGDSAAPKSGRAHRVALSRRLRWALLELYQAAGGSAGA